jgi:hypothetical protein
MGDRSPDLHYVPYHQLDEAPHVVVDGSPTGGTLLCLTHWPGIGSPPELAADLSAEMAFLYLGAFDRHPGASAVSNNHFDQDGLVSVFALSQPEAALAHRDRLVEVARAGDFAVCADRDAARISMTIAAFANPERSPLAGLAGLSDYAESTALLYTELLGRLDQLCRDPSPFRAWWEEEDANLTASEAALASGAVAVEEVGDIDLAVLTVPPDAPDGGGHRFAGEWVRGLHPMAVHHATERGALLTMRGQHFELSYRYESWVQYRSRAVRPRVDLAPLAEQLNAEEGGGGSDSGPGTWVAAPVSVLTPTLSLSGAGESTLAPGRVRSLVEAHLRQAPPAWDPYLITR